MSLDAWRELPIAQQPEWPDQDVAASVIADLRTFQPLVSQDEVDALRAGLAMAARGHAFVLQGGDCAETFDGSTTEQVHDRIKTMGHMATVLSQGGTLPVVQVGRMAGQFAKPRSSDTETREGVTLPAYRGDMVNGYEFTAESRTPDPRRMLQAYRAAASTLEVIREKQHGELFIGHEGLVLEYERALTRESGRAGGWLDTSAHFLWVGERTRDVNSAHVAFFSQVRNPIGVKLGPEVGVDEVLRLLEILDPQREPGRLTFITRMGAGQVRDVLPGVLSAAQAEGASPLWVCDPMHGNGITTPNGYKSRRFDDVVSEVQGFFAVHRELGTIPGGIHVELTGDDVAECLGGVDQIDENDLATRYESVCDPRLNYKQSLELAFLVAEELKLSHA